MRGLAGEAGQLRVTLDRAHGGEGGPVLDGHGAVVGILDKAVPGVPAQTRIAFSAPAIMRALSAAGFRPETLDNGSPLAALDIAMRASDITAKVAWWRSCPKAH